MSEFPNSDEIDERFQVLENKVLYQDRTIDELNSVVTQQQDQMDALACELKKLRRVLETLAEDGIDPAEEPPPPHY